MPKAIKVRSARIAMFSVPLDCALLSGAAYAEPKVVSGPAGDPQCMTPWSADTQFLQYPKKEGPYRIALANGYIANTWRIQMVQTAKAYAAQPDVAAKLKGVLRSYRRAKMFPLRYRQSITSSTQAMTRSS